MSLTETEKYNEERIIPPAQLEIPSIDARRDIETTSVERCERQIPQDQDALLAQSAEMAPAPIESEDTSMNDQILRVYTSQERIWFAIAGHGPDLSRITAMEFILLSLIATYREKGIFQPDITRLSGQDKRSVPKRTDALHEKGYIVKQSSYVRGFRTSICTLKRFTEDVARPTLKYLSTGEKSSIDDELTDLKDATLGSIKEMEPSLRKMIQMLEESQIITFNDLKRNLVRVLCYLQKLRELQNR